MVEKINSEECQTCFRSKSETATPTTQWKSVCRCDKPYSPNAQFSIDACMTCKKRVVANSTSPVRLPDLCACENPRPQSVPSFTKQKDEKEPVELDIESIHMSPEIFPIERYTPIAILGEGSRATVLLARDKQTGKKVAVKCFKNCNPEVLKSFDQEVKKLAKLSHTNIARLIGSGIHNQATPYLVTDYKDGFNLEQYLAIHGTPSHDVAVKILCGICEALIYAQKESLLHGNIRAGNVIFIDDMNAEPSISLLDFNVPRLKMSNQLDSKDTYYMSADQARGMEYNEKSEVYSIGCIGFALLTGRPPFMEGTTQEIKNLHALKLPPKISDLKFDSERPSDLVEVIERCLEKDPSYRFESVAKLLERLEVFPRREQTRIAAVLAERKKKKLVTIAGIVIAVTTILSTIGFFVLARH